MLPEKANIWVVSIDLKRASFSFLIAVLPKSIPPYKKKLFSLEIK